MPAGMIINRISLTDRSIKDGFLKGILLNERLIKNHVTKIICTVRGDEGGEKGPHYEYGTGALL